MKNETKQLTKEEILEIPILVETMTIAQIAEKYGVHPNTIKSWINKLRKNGYKVKMRKGRKGLLEKLKDNEK